MSTFVKVNGRPIGASGNASVMYFETTGQMVVRESGAECIVSTLTTKEWTILMAATAFIAAIGGTVTP